jgi:hypothetical protein
MKQAFAQRTRSPRALPADLDPHALVFPTLVGEADMGIDK